MQANIHTPQRFDNEAWENYLARRAASKAAIKDGGRYLFIAGVSKFYAWETGKNRRAAIAQAGGIRQFKKLQRTTRAVSL